VALLLDTIDKVRERLNFDLELETKTVKFPESTVAGAPITTLDPASSGARNYRQLAREVIAAQADR
jgi:chromosome partitioning protein